jgi:SAM-dependent methyltransferase
MSAREHYDSHLGPVYGWMVGGIDPAIERGAVELARLRLTPERSGIAVDLGAGFGAHAIPLARRGFHVLAIDSCAALLDELTARTRGLTIDVIQADLLSFTDHLTAEPELIVCMGDTLTHLADAASVSELIRSVSAALDTGGRFVSTFRDYSTPLSGERRFIPVRSDEHRILTCFLEYDETHVTVHDILHERSGTEWTFRVSTYRKVRIAPQWLVESLRQHGFTVARDDGPAGMVGIVATRTDAPGGASRPR